MYQLRIRDVGVGALAVVASVFIGSAVQAQSATWVDNQISYDFGFSGGLELDGLTADSRHFDTMTNPIVGDHSISFLGIGSGTIHGGYDAYFWDPAPHIPHPYGLNHNFEIGYSAERPGTGEPDPSTRTLWMTVSLSHVLHVTDPMDALGYTVSSPIAPWSLALLESGTWDGSTFTPSAQVLDFLTPYAGVTVLQPGDYRVRGELAFSYEVSGVSSVNSAFTWDLFPTVPAPGAAALLAFGGLVAARRRRTRA